ncbi:putative Late nodulin [Medicago truncatula]|uniref:Putative Late nodulin n=1 Tax=Medicago truncatula TaxID=3880 RepID=A0A396HMJ9_MEDTR|nr:putative Late nodulin [Medicago truncatula]
MNKTLKFVYVLILFISLSIVSKSVAQYNIGCKTDDDCQKYYTKMFGMKCFKSWCITGILD